MKTIRIETIAPGVVRLRQSEMFEQSLQERYGLLSATPLPGADADFSVTENEIRLKNGFTIRLDIRPESDGQTWAERSAWFVRRFAGQERGPSTKLVEGDPHHGLRKTDPEAANSPHRFGAAFSITPGERFYGLGEGADDHLNLRGGAYQNWVVYQKDEIAIPFFMSSAGWGVLVNNSWRHFVDVGCREDNELTILGENGELDLFILAGDSFAEMISLYTGLTGHPMLLPKWAYGLTYIAPIYANQFEVAHEAREFRNHSITCDMISLEPGWMTKFYDHSTKKEWDLPKFHMPMFMRRDKEEHQSTIVAALGRYGFKVSLWLCSDYDFTAEAECEVTGEPVSPLESWYEHISGFTQDGIKGYKLDPCSLVDTAHPGLINANGRSFEEMHNINQILWPKQMYEGYAKQTGLRPMHHSCGGYSGIQKWSASNMGDNGGLDKPLNWILTLALCGHSNTTCDMNIHHAESIHFSFFLPWAHLNNWQGFNQPWWAGDDMQSLFAEYARMRYRMLPYIYSCAIEAHETGLAIVRPMPLAYPGDEATWNCNRQYMFGPWYLVGTFDRQLHIPQGLWQNCWTGEIIEGPCDVECDIPADRGGALFVCRGAIVPTWCDRDYVAQHGEEEIILDIFPCGESSYLFREDDGLTIAYERQRSCHTLITCRADERETLIEIGERDGDYQGKPAERVWKVRVHGAPSPVRVVCHEAACRVALET